MKAIIATITLSLSLPIAAQVSGGGAAGAGAGGGAGASGAGVGSAGGTGVRGGVVGIGGAPVGPSGAAGPITGTSPTGALAGQQPGPNTSAVNPAGNPIGNPSLSGPRGTFGPGGSLAIPSQSSGQTFDRPFTGAAPAGTFPPPTTPAGTPTSTFDPVTGLPNARGGGSAGIGFPPAGTFPGAPVGVANSVGTNFGGLTPTSVPREPVAVNLPPGARVVPNPVTGVPEAIVPAPDIVATNAGGATGLQRGAATGTLTPRTVPNQRPVGSAPAVSPRVVRPNQPNQ